MNIKKSVNALIYKAIRYKQKIFAIDIYLNK